MTVHVAVSQMLSLVAVVISVAAFVLLAVSGIRRPKWLVRLADHLAIRRRVNRLVRERRRLDRRMA